MGLNCRFRAEPIRWVGHLLVWTALLATTLLMASMFQALVTNAPGAPATLVRPAVRSTPSPLTAALADGDDIRARFLTRLAAEQASLQPDPESP